MSVWTPREDTVERPLDIVVAIGEFTFRDCRMIVEHAALEYVAGEARQPDARVAGVESCHDSTHRCDLGGEDGVSRIE